MSFSLDLSKFVEKAKGNTHQVVQKTAINLISAVIDRSPVGNPELWAENKTAAEYNLEVVRYNQSLRDSPENLTKAGRLRRGLKVNDSMDIKAPDGYVGGRFRGNWQVTFDVKATGTLERIDPQGDDTKAAARGVVLGFTSDVGTIWAVIGSETEVQLTAGGSPLALADGQTIAEALDVQLLAPRATVRAPKARLTREGRILRITPLP